MRGAIAHIARQISASSYPMCQAILNCMASALRIVIASYGSAQFQFLYETLIDSGHIPVAYMVSRSMRSSMAPEADILDAIRLIIDDLPLGMDLLLPGGAASVADMIAGYQPDLLLVFGFNWRLPSSVLELPRLGVLNVHPSALPKYRGPSPVLRAIRNGEKFMGLTVHRMNEKIDAGPVLAQINNIPFPDEVTSEEVWRITRRALPSLLNIALDRTIRGDPGIPQDESKATYAGFPSPEWSQVTWRGSRRSIHNQIRALRYLNGGQSLALEREGRSIQVVRTSLEADGGVRIDCADGPLWITYSEHRSG